MSRCWLEGEWRAYLDRELPAAEMDAAGQHLGTCQACSALVRELSGRAERVGALMAALEYVPEARPVVARPVVAIPARSWKRRWVAAAAGLAAVLALIAAWPAKRPAVSKAPVVGQAGSLRRTGSPPAADRGLPTRLQLTKLPHKADAQPEYFIALDDEPIESGVVVQVTLPDTGLLAEVIYDDYGRPRAVRPLN